MNSALQNRSIYSFLFKRIIIVLVVALFCLFGFLTASSTTNCMVLLEEGMSARAEYALSSGSNDELIRRFFSAEYIKSGDLTNLKLLYSDFKITNYSHSTSIKSIWVWPGSRQTSAIVEDKINRNTFRGEKLYQESNAKLPEWQSGTYRVDLKYYNNRWYIDNITLIELAPTPTPTPEPTPDPSQSPDASQSPGISPQPTAGAQ